RTRPFNPVSRPAWDGMTSPGPGQSGASPDFFFRSVWTGSACAGWAKGTPRATSSESARSSRDGGIATENAAQPSPLARGAKFSLAARTAVGNVCGVPARPFSTGATSRAGSVTQGETFHEALSHRGRPGPGSDRAVAAAGVGGLQLPLQDRPEPG